MKGTGDFMKRVFICSPYRGDVEKNLTDARSHARMAAVCGYCPVVPHLLFPQFLDDNKPEERIMGISLGVEQLKVCDEIWIFGGTISNGMAYEIEQAKKLCVPARMYDNKENRIFAQTLLIDDRVDEDYRKAVQGLKFV
jgi:hypothetical protein